LVSVQEDCFAFTGENLDVIPKALGVILKTAQLMERAQTNALACRLEEVEMPIAGLPDTF
jgi:hypothetical protein